jgi:hypothetical protein
MKNILLEEINRNKLLMKYNNKKTLSENIQEGNLLTEQTLRKFLTTIFKTSDEVALNLSKQNLTKDYLAAKSLLNDAKIFGKAGFNDVDELINALIGGTITKPQLSNMAKGLLKSGKATGALKDELINTAAKITAKNAKNASMSEAQIVKELVSKGYPKTIAKEIAAKAKSTVVNPNLIKKEKVQTPTGGNKFWTKYKPMLANIGKSKALKYLLIAGGTYYLAWRYFIEEGSKPFPDCLRNGVSAEDFKVIVEGDLSWVKIGQTGNKIIDLEGGGKFWDNGRFSTVNGRYDGKWKESDGGIDVIIEGTVYPISCDKFEPVDKCPEGQTWDGTKCVLIQTPPKPDEEITPVTPVTPSPDEVTTTTTTVWRPTPIDVDSESDQV